MIEQEAIQVARPDPEVKPPVGRKSFSAAEKLRILDEVDACTESGEIGALVRREGIHSSYLTRWRRARSRGELDGSKAKKRGPKSDADKEVKKENTEQG